MGAASRSGSPASVTHPEKFTIGENVVIDDRFLPPCKEEEFLMIVCTIDRTAITRGPNFNCNHDRLSYSGGDLHKPVSTVSRMSRGIGVAGLAGVSIVDGARIGGCSIMIRGFGLCGLRQGYARDRLARLTL